MDYQRRLALAILACEANDDLVSPADHFAKRSLLGSGFLGSWILGSRTFGEPVDHMAFARYSVLTTSLGYLDASMM